mmetsp:Transcript_6371/g.15307  ORF Transcript_6371/g.15307 Transcript_6371/m.15307 type:complete len:326 (-) Transcript_6371:388-1365(-)
MVSRSVESCVSASSLVSRTRLSTVAGRLESHLVSTSSLVLRQSPLSPPGSTTRGALALNPRHSSLTRYTISSMSTATPSSEPNLSRSRSSSRVSCRSYCALVRLTGESGSRSRPARRASRNVAAAMPNMAGSVPRTGIVRTRKLGTTWKSSGSCPGAATWSMGRSLQVGFSTERSTVTPLLMPWSFRSLDRTERARGSTLVSLMSANRSRVGSSLAPAPPTHSTGIPRRWHAARSATLVSMLSMASSTKSGPPPRCASSVSASNISTLGSSSASGQIRRKCRSRHVAFGSPTSERVATACLLRDDRVTWSKSIRRSFPTPDLNNR